MIKFGVCLGKYVKKRGDIRRDQSVSSDTHQTLVSRYQKANYSTYFVGCIILFPVQGISRVAILVPLYVYHVRITKKYAPPQILTTKPYFLIRIRHWCRGAKRPTTLHIPCTEKKNTPHKYYYKYEAKRF